MNDEEWYCENCSEVFLEWQIECTEELEINCCPKCGDTDIHVLEE